MTDYFEPLSAAAEVAADFDDTFNFDPPQDGEMHTEEETEVTSAAMADVLAKLSAPEVVDSKKRKNSDVDISSPIEKRRRRSNSSSDPSNYSPQSPQLNALKYYDSHSVPNDVQLNENKTNDNNSNSQSNINGNDNDNTSSSFSSASSSLLISTLPSSSSSSSSKTSSSSSSSSPQLPQLTTMQHLSHQMSLQHNPSSPIFPVPLPQDEENLQDESQEQTSEQLQEHLQLQQQTQQTQQTPQPPQQTQQTPQLELSQQSQPPSSLEAPTSPHKSITITTTYTNERNRLFQEIEKNGIDINLFLKSCHEKYITSSPSSSSSSSSSTSTATATTAASHTQLLPKRSNVKELTKGVIYNRDKKIVQNLIKKSHLDNVAIAKDLVHAFKVPKQHISHVVDALNAFFKTFKGKGRKNDTLRKAKEYILTMLCWKDGEDVSYREICKELNLNYQMYKPLFEKAKERTKMLKSYFKKIKKKSMALKIEQEKNSGNTNGHENGKGKGKGKKRKRKNVKTDTTATHPMFYSGYKKRKDSTDSQVLKHASKFYYECSKSISTNAINGRRRMDMIVVEAYTKWLRKIKLPIINGGLNKSPEFKVSLAIFKKARPTDVLVCGREGDNDYYANGSRNANGESNNSTEGSSSSSSSSNGDENIGVSALL